MKILDGINGIEEVNIIGPLNKIYEAIAHFPYFFLIYRILTTLSIRALSSKDF